MEKFKDNYKRKTNSLKFYLFFGANFKVKSSRGDYVRISITGINHINGVSCCGRFFTFTDAPGRRRDSTEFKTTVK